MSSYILKSKILKCKTKPKKCRNKPRSDLDKIEKEYNSYSCEKENYYSNNYNNFKIENNVIKIKNIDDLRILPLNNIDYIHSAWKSSKIAQKNFEDKILDTKNFKINFETFDIMTKSEEADNELKDEQFWILYSDYLLKNNKIKNAQNFLKVINKAFSYMEQFCLEYKLLIYYYFDKIKKINPIIKNGKIEEKDEPYIDLLENSVKNKIKIAREKFISDVKITTSNQKYKKNINEFYEYTPMKKKKK